MQDTITTKINGENEHIGTNIILKTAIEYITNNREVKSALGKLLCKLLSICPCVFVIMCD